MEIYGLTVRRPRKSAIADAKIQTECSDDEWFLILVVALDDDYFIDELEGGHG